MKNEFPGRLLSVAFEDAKVLQAAYMPFIKNGGLFIPTVERFDLGDEVFVMLRLPGDGSGIPLAGRVVWITPEGAQGGREAGIGVQLNERDNLARQCIEEHLAGVDDIPVRDSYTL